MTKAEQRRQNTISKIQAMNIACNKHLPLIDGGFILKSKEDICRRAVANMLAIQHACDIANNNEVKKSKKFFKSILKHYGVQKCLLDKEKRLFGGKYSQQDVVDVMWTYEDNWALLWALGKIDGMGFPDSICNIEKAVTAIQSCETFEDFAASCNLRNSDEILDELDLYYCMHWACVEKQLNPQTPIGNLNWEVVVERRRGLEWLVGEEDDWNDISLDT